MLSSIRIFSCSIVCGATTLDGDEISTFSVTAVRTSVEEGLFSSSSSSLMLSSITILESLTSLSSSSSEISILSIKSSSFCILHSLSFSEVLTIFVLLFISSSSSDISLSSISSSCMVASFFLSLLLSTVLSSWDFLLTSKELDPEHEKPRSPSL